VSDVELFEDGRLARIHLNRPHALNALTHPMVRAIGAALARWQDDPAVVAVLVTGEGERAFCAGGDVLEVARLAREEGVEAATPFFFDEYRMNWRIKHFPKPYLAILDGVTMGGGVGLSVHGTHRIATEATLFAMPETAIGMFPDVGGTHVLGTMPGGLGNWLALTGARLGPGDTLDAGIATHYCPRAGLDDLVAGLRDAKDAPAVERTVRAHTAGPEPGEIAAHHRAIETVFDRPSVEAIGEAAAVEPSGWGAKQWQLIAVRSPTSVRLAFAQLTRGRALEFDDAMRLEYRIVHRILAGHDFFEGVRAVLIDKDQNPRWRPATLDAVDETAIEAYFAELAGGDLQLDWN
jgi:enoyl-CoA hydratase